MSENPMENFVWPVIEEVIQDRAEKEEMFCEMALTDPEQRGVLVIETDPTSYSIELSKEVPYGQMHIRQLWRGGA